MKVIKYMTVNGFIDTLSGNRPCLEDLVGSYFKSGWELYGPPFITQAREGMPSKGCQVMVKYEQ